MSEQPFGPRDGERVSRLAGPPPAETATSAGPAARDDKSKRRPSPRSYSRLGVTDEEKLWAAVAHACVWITLLTSAMTGGALIPLSVFVPLVIYFMFRKRSDFVSFHALQAFVIQLVGTVGALSLLLVGGTVWLVGLVVCLLAMIVLVGFILVPVWGLVGILLLLATGLLPLAALLLGTIAAVETYHGRDYRYPFIARWVDRQLAGSFLNAA